MQLSRERIFYRRWSDSASQRQSAVITRYSGPSIPANRELAQLARGRGLPQRDIAMRAVGVNVLEPMQTMTGKPRLH